jgi:hypothetical protein
LYSSPLPFVQRIRGDTTVATGWPATGLQLASTGYANQYVPVRLVRSDANHFIAAWVDLEGTQVVECQRFSLAGSLDPAWPPNGVRLDSLVSGNQNQINLTCVEDGAGGVIVGWSETTRYRVRHIRADGTTPGRYASGSLTIFSGVSPIGFAQGALARGQGEGSCVFWQDQATGIRGRWLDGDGNALGCGAPNDTCSVLILADTGARVAGATADGSGGAYILYGKYVASLDEVHYVTHTLDPVTTSVPPTGRTSGLWLAVSPNPAPGALTVTFALPDARPARLEVLDLAGRRMLARDVSGAGEHVEELTTRGALAPGVYVVSVAQGGDRRTARAVVVR